MSNYYFFITNEGNTDLLKEEIKLKLQNFRLSYSQGEFVTYVSDDKLPPLSIAQKNIIFSKMSGVCYRSVEQDKLYDLFSTTVVNEYKIFRVVSDSLECSQFNSFISVEGDHFVQIVRTNNNKFIVTVTHKCANYFWNYNGESQITLPVEAPSRAYLKIAENDKLFSLKLSSSDVVVEIGSAPGGATYYMLQKGCRLFAFDPGEMSSNLDTSSYKFKRKSIQDIVSNDLPNRVDWIVVDMNLDFLESLEKTVSLMKIIGKIKGLVFTAKVTKPKLIKSIDEIITTLKHLRARDIFLQQIPSNKREFCVIAKFKD